MGMSADAAMMLNMLALTDKVTASATFRILTGNERWHAGGRGGGSGAAAGPD